MAQTLETVIAINARTGNGFQKVGATLTELGSIVNGLSQELIAFGSDSLNVYRDYQKSMKDAEVALSTTYGRNTRELGNVMSMLDASATEWAATTIFHTNDVANAISEAAHAGWDYEQIMSGIPAAMQLAQAGSLDLSEAVNYIVKSTSAAGIEFEDLTNFTDLWTYAANSSASTIGEFGDAMLRMGSTMRFVANPEELMTLIAVTANAGSTGSEAGTMIRNSMIRLIAPTKKAKDAMAELGATSEETAGLLDDGALAAANARLEAVGFSAYDEKGQLKSVLDTYSDLYVALGQVAGGYENIEKNRDAVEILSAIFPTRTITEAITLLRGASEEWDGLYDAMQNGAAAGYGEYAASTMMSSLDGRIEIFESKVERLKQVVGKELSGDVEKALDLFGGMIDDVANMDEKKLGALISGLEVIAGAGPALLTTGAALRLFGLLLSPAGGIAMGAIALGAAAAAIHDLEEADFESAFGYGTIDHAAINAALEQQARAYEEATEKYREYIGVLDESASKYQETSEAFSSNLFTSMITGATLTDADKESLRGLAKEMRDTVVEGLQSETDASISYWEMFFGGSESAGENDTFLEISGVISDAGADAVSEAKRTGQKIREALISAFEDDQISDDEYQKIVDYMQEYNAAIARAQAEAAEREAQVEMETKLQKLQGASWDEIKQGVGEIQNARDETWATQNDDYLRERARLTLDYNDKIAKKEATESDRDSALAALDAKHASDKYAHDAWYDDSIRRAFEGGIQQSGYAEKYNNLEQLANDVLSGRFSADEAVGRWGEDKNLGRLVAEEIAAFGGYGGLQEKIAQADAAGNASMGTYFRQLYTMDQLNSNFANNVMRTGKWDIPILSWLPGIGREFFGGEYLQSSNQGGYEELAQFRRDQFESMTGVNPGGDAASLQAQPSINAEDVTASMTGQTVQVPVTADTEQLTATIDESVNAEEHKVQLTPEMGNEAQSDWSIGGMSLPLSPEVTDSGSVDAFLGQDWRIRATPEIDESGMESLGPYPVKVEPYLEGEDPVTELQSQGVQVDVSGDTQSLTATIDAENGKELLEYVNGDASNLEMSITGQDGRTLTENVHGDISSLRSAIDSQNGRTITVNIRGNRLFASGGRATEASIFGEAGPEWAIPEEHSERTAQLLDAAREASGFTWPDLLARVGGLNADTGTPRTTIVYSPTINAADVTGVEQALVEDKERLDKWFEEKKMMDEVEVYT